MPGMSHRPQPRSLIRRAFSLMELLVVLAILTVVIAIVVPSIRHFRDTSRKMVTTDLMASLATSIGQFKLSQNRLPSYFSTAEIGSSMNGDTTAFENFTSMENIMLDLAGGITQDAPSASMNYCDVATGPAVVRVGPGTNKVNVKLGLIGAASGGSKSELVRSYYKPDPKYFIRQCQPNQRAGASGAHFAMPVLVDAWGNPILAWVQDDAPQVTPQLVRSDSTTRGKSFYARSNYAFTQATSLGRLGRNQATDSLLGTTQNADADLSLRGVVGNPAFPGESRGTMVFHSAGANGVYIGREERGAKSAGLLSATGVTGSLGVSGNDHFTDGSFDDVVSRTE